jgi:hypothetical protein
MIADLIWALLKHEPEEVIWCYLPRGTRNVH